MGIILSSAIEYFDKFGFSVIPSNRFKKPLVPWSENQKKKADLQQIVSWWKDFPSANITLVTGRISNLFVIDCDNEEGFLKIQKMLPDDLVVPIAKTPRDGYHLWFSFPMETNLTVGELIPKVDFKGEGGCITSVPSVRDGKVYTWIIPPEPNNLPPVPPKLLEFILEKTASNNKYNSYINKENEVTEDDNTTKDNIHYNILQEGTRDNDLFHIANTMIKGGAKPEFTEQLLEIIAEKICIPPFPQREIKAKVKSAMSRIKRRDRNLADEVREYFLLQEGYTFTTDIQQTLQITTLEEKKNLTVILTRLLQDGIIERYGEKRGCYRPVNLQTKNMEFIEEAIPEFEIRLPFRMGDILSIYPKNIIILAGDKSAGKSAFCLNVAHMNQDLHPVHYLSSEMVEEEWSVRLKKWGISKKSEIRYQMEECSTDFHNKIGPDHKIYIVDYLEVNDNFWEIGKMIRKIHDKLRDGICFIAIQKKTNAYLGRGAEFSLEKARLYLSLDFMPKESCSKLTIVDAKAPRMGESIRGYWKKIKIIDSIKLSSEDNTWRT